MWFQTRKDTSVIASGLLIVLIVDRIVISQSADNSSIEPSINGNHSSGTSNPITSSLLFGKSSGNQTLSSSSSSLSSTFSSLSTPVEEESESDYDLVDSPPSALTANESLKKQKTFDEKIGELLDSMKSVLSEVKSNLHQNSSEDVESEALTTEGVSAGKKSGPSARQVWITYGTIFQKLIDSIAHQSLPDLLNSKGIPISDNCTMALFTSFSDMRLLRPWVFKMLDASGRILPSGLLSGSITDLGSYDQCMEVDSSTESRGSASSTKILGQYCIVKYNTILPARPEKLTLQSRIFNFTGTKLEDTVFDTLGDYVHVCYDRVARVGVCIPSACTSKDLQTILDFALDGFYVYANVSTCDVNTDSVGFTSFQKWIIGFLALILVLMVIGTVMESFIIYITPKYQSDSIRLSGRSSLMKILLCFSVITNGEEALSTEQPSGSVEAINGIKVLSMAWILFTHTYLIPIKESFAFSTNFMHSVENLIFQLVLNGWVLVDSFFFVGALLTTYSQLRGLDKRNGQINFIQVAVNRFMRLSPLVWLAILLIRVLPSLGSGPLWKEYFDYQVSKCENYWWATALYINNWFPESKMCLIHTWYLAADMQMYLTSMLLIVPLFKWPRIGFILTLSTIILSSLLTGFLTYIRDAPPTVIYNTPSEQVISEQATATYMTTYSHIGPYCIGVLVGFLLHQKRKYIINPLVSLSFWLLSISAVLAILFSTHGWNIGKPWTPLSAAIYAATHRIGWAAAVAWICFACQTGNGGPVNTFLSWKFFVPLSKLSFSIYLMHFLLLWVRYAYMRETLPFSHYTMFCEFIINFVLSTLAALFAHLAIEAPFHRLYKFYFSSFCKWSQVRLKKGDTELLRSPRMTTDVTTPKVRFTNNDSIVSTSKYTNNDNSLMYKL